MLALAGCAAPITIVSAGLGVAQAGTAAFTEGKLSTAWEATLCETHDAARAALQSLEYGNIQGELHERNAWVNGREMEGRLIEITLVSSSANVTSIRIRVGFWGDQPISRIILDQMREEFEKAQGRAPAGVAASS